LAEAAPEVNAAAVALSPSDAATESLSREADHESAVHPGEEPAFASGTGQREPVGGVPAEAELRPGPAAQGPAEPAEPAEPVEPVGPAEPAVRRPVERRSQAVSFPSWDTGGDAAGARGNADHREREPAEHQEPAATSEPPEGASGQ
jgi:hypothetical protein